MMTHAHNESASSQHTNSEAIRRYFGAELLPFITTCPLLEAIGREHQRILKLLDQTERCDAWKRRSRLAKLSSAVRTFIDCQEASLFPTSRELPELAYLIDDARGDQRYVLRILRELERKSPDELMWEETFARFSSALREYLTFEARSLLPRAYRYLDRTALSALERRFAARRASLLAHQRSVA